MKVRLLALFVCVFAAGLASAAHAPRVEGAKEARREAPEYLRVKVIGVRKQRPGGMSAPTLLWAESEVVKAYRSRAGLKAGERITIIYSMYDEEQSAQLAKGQEREAITVSPVYPPELKEGRTYVVFLRRQEGNGLYVPAAAEHSFIRKKG